MSDDLPSRREFITGRSRRQDERVPLDEQGHPLQGEALEQFLRESSYVEHYSQRAMACLFEFIFNLEQYEQAPETAMLAFEELARLEDQMSIYRDWSELSRINQTAANGWVEVEPRLYSLLRLASRLYDETHGAFDITSTPLSTVWGFSKREGRFPTDAEREQALRCVGMPLVSFDDARRALRFERAEVEINLNGIGKGYALDQCCDQFEHHGMTHFLLHGGQSSIIARGSRSGMQQLGKRGWTVGLSHPIWPENRMIEFQLVDCALGTSGTGRQSFYYQGKRYGHILDPRTGIPADGILSSTVIAPTAAQADALATALYVMGIEETREFCVAHPEIGALLMTAGSRRGEVECHAFNLSDDQWRRIDA